jgi:hypothetical protein
MRLMSRFYKDLHDREILTQAEALVSELQRRKLVDVFLPLEPLNHFVSEDKSFPRRVQSVSIQNGRLQLTLEPSFFRNHQPSDRNGS